MGWYNCPMIFPRFLWLVTVVLLIAALVMGVWAGINLGKAVVVVEWATASELNTVGYHLYRSDSPQGPYTRINPNLIPPAEDPLTGDEYTYKDNQVVAGKTYYYELEDIESSGISTRHGPITVKARSTASLQLVLAVVLGITALFCGYILWSYQKRVSANDPSTMGESIHEGN